MEQVLECVLQLVGIVECFIEVIDYMLSQRNVLDVAKLVVLYARQAFLQLARLVWLLYILCVVHYVQRQRQIILNSLKL